MSQMANVEDFIESLTEEQKECVYWIVGNAAKLRDRQKYYDAYMTLTEAQKENLWGVVSLAMEILRGQWMINEIIYKIFLQNYPKMPISDYRPLDPAFTKGKRGITIFMDNGDTLLYFPEVKECET